MCRVFPRRPACGARMGSEKWWRTAQQIREFYEARKAGVEQLPSGQRTADPGGARFKLIGGPYHDKMVRMYAPFEELVFPDGSRYVLGPPIRKNGHWVYVHEPLVSTESEDDGTE